MRVFLLVLLLAICASAGFFDTKLGEKIKKTLGKIKAALNGTLLMKIREKFIALREKIKAKLKLSPARKALLGEIMKHIIKIKKDKIQEKGDSIEEINSKSAIGELLYQGDIVLTNKQAQEIVDDIEGDENDRGKRQAFRDRNYPRTLWSKGVYYYFHGNATPEVRSVFTKGARLWMKDTCIDFFESNSAPDRIRVFKEQGCWSYVGRIGGQQDLSLGKGCESVGTAAHEIGHAIGFYHTHSRHDRDNFITFNAQNVKPDWLDQFTKQTPATNENYGITYDYGSIMHYGANSASANGQPSMVPFDPKYVETLGSPIISFYELLMINKPYECTKNCDPNTSAQCKMGGFPHPRDCGRCICPSGYGGQLCDQKPSGCGSILQATAQYQNLHDKRGNEAAGQRPREDMDFCYYWITAPQGSRIEIKIADLSRGAAVDGCQYWGVEIKTHADQRLTGYRFCAPEDVGRTLVSNSNIVPIITYNRFYATTVDIQYRIVGGNVGGPRPQPQPNSNCVDNEQCATLIRTKNFCQSRSFTESVKRGLCPKACGFCR
uniref:Zinc metalloproteinase n=1 Tax=Ancylostoma ceylanicum TaxID=53326 RepID=Q8I6X1_9BILA|nr:metalloprotease 1 precursor [Ancylostoma ceylanicum]